MKVLDLYPDRQDGSDVSNWLEDDTAGAKLVALAKKVPLWELSADSSSSDSSTSDDALIAELAALSPVQYEKRREAARPRGAGHPFIDRWCEPRSRADSPRGDQPRLPVT